jgi:hypothetical protein
MTRDTHEALPRNERRPRIGVERETIIENITAKPMILRFEPD